MPIQKVLSFVALSTLAFMTTTAICITADSSDYDQLRGGCFATVTLSRPATCGAGCANPTNSPVAATGAGTGCLVIITGGHPCGGPALVAAGCAQDQQSQTDPTCPGCGGGGGGCPPGQHCLDF